MSDPLKQNGFIVAAPSSGSGKTVITLALLRAFRNRNLSVGSFKIGPDYIDPGFHTAATGKPCRNIDLWAMRRNIIESTLAETAKDVNLIIGEGVMGFFDGAAVGGGSTADKARKLLFRKVITRSTLIRMEHLPTLYRFVWTGSIVP